MNSTKSENPIFGLKVSPGFMQLSLALCHCEPLRPVSNVALLPCQAGSTVARLQHGTRTTWFQTSNLIQSKRTAVDENKTQK